MDEQNIISVEQVEGVVLVTFNVPSISSVSSVERISERLRPIASSSDALNIVIDFDGVKFFSSLVLGMLVDVWRRLKNAGGRLVISGINPQLSRVFRITNLDTIFQFYPDRSSAIAAVIGS